MLWHLVLVDEPQELAHRFAGVEAPHVVLCGELLDPGVAPQLRAGELQLHVPQVLHHGCPPRALGSDVRGGDLERCHESLDRGIELLILPISKFWENTEGLLSRVHRDRCGQSQAFSRQRWWSAQTSAGHGAMAYAQVYDSSHEHLQSQSEGCHSRV